MAAALSRASGFSILAIILAVLVDDLAAVPSFRYPGQIGVDLDNIHRPRRDEAGTSAGPTRAVDSGLVDAHGSTVSSAARLAGVAHHATNAQRTVAVSVIAICRANWLLTVITRIA